MGGACLRQSSTAAVAPTPAKLVDAPSPEEIVAMFETVDFASQTYAEAMLRNGRDPKSDAEKVWRSRYTAELLCDAASAVAATLGAEVEVLRALRDMPPLTETIVYDAERWSAEVVPRYQAAVDALNGEPKTPEVEQLRGMLLKVKDLFYWEVQNPKQDFYMCMLDEMHVKYSSGREIVSVPQESLRMMHAIDMPVHQRKSDVRRDTIALFYMRIYEEGVAGHEGWELQDVLQQHGNDVEMRALSSETPLLSFELDENEPTFPGYVLMEGSGRLAALNAALDMVWERHPLFVAPLISIMILPFHGPPMVRRNLRFFLELTWRCTFPDVDIPGWQGQVQALDSARPVSDQGAEEVRQQPRYYGYSPLAPTRCKAAVVAGGARLAAAVREGGG